MKIKRPLLTLVISVSLAFFAACSSPLIYTAVWQNKPVTIDGKATEWKIPLDYFDDKTKLNFTVTNDDTNMYICVRATEDETQRGIVRTGMQIWIDTTGGKKAQVGIQFPIIDKSAGGVNMSAAHSGQSDNMDAANRLKNHYRDVEKQIRLLGFKNVADGLAQVPNIYGINACLNWDTNNIMIYEACIPFSTFYKKSLSVADSNKVLGISFIVTVNPPRNNYQEGGGGGGRHGGGMGGGMGGMGGGGMGGMGGGGMHGGEGHSGGKGESNGSEAESLTTHIKLRLAVQPPSK